MKLFNNMRNTGFALLGGIALLTISAAMTGCSENVESGLYAADGSNISLSISASGFHNGLLEIGSAQSSTVFSVESSTRWIVEVSDCEGAWCQIVYGDSQADDAGHIGDGTFIVEAAPNRSGNDRECNVTVYAVESDGTHIPGRSVEIHLEQDRQSILVDYAGDVISPLGTTPSTEPRITVTANQAWSVSTSHPWVSVVPGDGMSGDSFTPESGVSDDVAVSFRISVEGNPGTSTRYAEVTVSSPTSAFTPIRLNVTQEGSSETFFITPTNVPVVPNAGDVVEFMVYSPRESWSVSAISAGDWVTLDRTSGEASSEPVMVRATVAANPVSVSRQAGVVFTRGGNMGETTITITQAPAPADTPDPEVEPVVSAAWIINGWTQTWAQLRAYYLSPAIPISGCGAFIHPVSDESATREFTGRLSGDNLIIVDMENLEPNTEYKAWGYIEYEFNGSKRVTTGEATYFTTPDKNGQPNSNDNNPPSVN